MEPVVRCVQTVRQQFESYLKKMEISKLLCKLKVMVGYTSEQ